MKKKFSSKNKTDQTIQKLKKQFAKRRKHKWKNLFKHKRLRFLKHPFSLLIISIFFVILLLPTMIVVPFSNASEQKEKETESYSLDEVESPLTIPVVRSETNETENVPLETYVLRVVASEMPTDFEIEALKAQSLAARTYIVNHLLIGDSKKKKVTDTVEHQVYQDDFELRQNWGNEYEERIAKIKKAVEATAGEIITYKEQPITPAFFSTSNGYTENSEDYWEQKLPYLRSVESPWDESSPKFHSQEIISLETLNEKLETNIKPTEKVEIRINRTDGNRVKKVKIGPKIFTGRQLRERLQLPSSDFSIEQKGDHFVFTVNGYGHGVGMSQYGANGMAKQGKDYKEIIHYYYQDVKIQSIDESAVSLVSNES